MKYKNISDKDLWLPGIGTVKAGEITDQPDGFNNANFEKIKELSEDKGREVPSQEKIKKGK